MTALPGYIDPELWAAFVDQRSELIKLKKVPFTQRAQLLVIRKLMRLHNEGHDANLLLEASAINSWRDVYPNDKTKKKIAGASDKDPALLKIEADDKLAVPMPAYIKELKQKMRMQG